MKITELSKSLQMRVMVFSHLMLLVLFIFIAALVANTVYQENKQRMLASQQIANQQLTQVIEQEIAERVQTLEQFAPMLVENNQLLSPPAIQQRLDNRVWLHSFFNNGLVVTDKQGLIIVDSPIVEGRVGIDASSRAFIQQALQTQKSVVTRPLTGKAMGKPIFNIAAPILSQEGQSLGIFFGVTLLQNDNFLLKLSTRLLGNNLSHFYVIDKNNNLIVASSNSDLVLKPLSDYVEVCGILKAVQAGEMSGFAKSALGEKVMFSSDVVAQLGWQVIHAVPEKQIFAPVWPLLRNLGWLLVGLMLLVMVATTWFVRRELKPLERGVDQIDDITLGRTEMKLLSGEGVDELGRLISAFNRLLAKQQQALSDVRDAQASAEQANKTKSEFLANMSHEIRTPLNAVIGLSEIMVYDDDIPDKNMRRVRQIHGSAKLLLGIINDVLDYSKIESGRLEVEHKAFKLNEVLDQLSLLFSSMTVHKGVELAFHLRPDVATHLVGDSLRLTQVLTNLMGNAVKFTEKGEIELCIRSQQQDDESVELFFAVRDTGIGMTESQRNRLFSAFMQADTSITRKHGGTGLGLVISQRLVHLMGGSDIQVESNHGHGSVFSFSIKLPVVQSESESKPHHFNCDPSPCRALVVDDQSISRAILREILESWHFEVDEAEDGEQAVNMVAEHLEESRFYRVILMDWEMPKMNGLLALQHIKQLYLKSGHAIDLPALMMVSAHDETELAMAGEDRYPFIHKPFSPSHLYNAIHQLDRLERLGVVEMHKNVVFENQKILVVEDNEINQAVVAELLSDLNLDVAYVENGELAVEAVKQQNFKLVLMDIQMPVMDGYEATRLIREFNPSIPIIALTAAAMIEDKNKALAAGMDAHLSKPIDPKALKQVMMGYLAHHEIEKVRSIETAMHQASVNMLENPGGKETHQQVENVLQRSKPRVLIVDDEPANARVLANGLKEDYVLLLANSGEKAMKLAQKEPRPDLVLLDIMMPDMDGYQVCHQLKNDPKTSNIPIVFVSALDQRHDEEKGLNMGAVDYISKPFHLPIVKSRIRNHLALKLKTDLLEEMSHMDGLTHIANRRQFDETLVRESQRLARSGKPLGLIMLDIDFFKPFNDHYGHGQGDMCLQKVAQALQNVVRRPGDLLARYGGEEFVVLLPETGQRGTQRVAEELRQTVEALRLTHEYSAVAEHVTISVGAVSGWAQNHEQAEQMLKQADGALYQAKNNGRNRVYLV